jgi:16S rRNA (adenine1518-N6/adenine1519-N6)-dimethyltransferase
MQHKPKKRLGQNFLVDKNLQRKIIVSCELRPCDVVLEIGSGRGELTRLIVDKVKLLYALELDKALCEVLRDEFKTLPNIKVLNFDILRLDLASYFVEPQDKIKVIGNIPYYITTPIIERLLKYRRFIDAIFLTVQKEVGRRITASAGSKEYGALSCFVQYYTEAKILFTLKNTCFSPSPKVDSCFLRLDIKKNLPLDAQKELFFFRVVRASFNQRRKTLRNSLKDIFPKEKLGLYFSKYGLDVNVRPEELSLPDFINLINT